MTKSCPYCGGELVYKNYWQTSEYRSLRFTSAVPGIYCQRCDDIRFAKDAWEEHYKRFLEFAKLVDAELGPENFGGVDLADSETS